MRVEERQEPPPPPIRCSAKSAIIAAPRKPRNPPSDGWSSTTASWCRGCATARRITTGTLDKVRAYLSEHRSALPPVPGRPSAPARAVNGAGCGS